MTRVPRSGTPRARPARPQPQRSGGQPALPGHRCHPSPAPVRPASSLCLPPRRPPGSPGPRAAAPSALPAARHLPPLVPHVPEGDHQVSYDPPASIPIPADIERPDKILAGLTARQVAILATAAAIIWAAFEATRRLVAPPVFAVLAAPLAVAAAALVMGQRDGLTLDRLLIAAWRHARSPRRLVTAPGGIPAAPAWAGPQLARRSGGPPAPLDPLYRAVASDGVIGLGDGGAAVAAAVSTVNLALRTPAEQDALTAAYGRWLNSLTGPVQILIRAGRADLTGAIADLEEAAPALPDPALEAAALDHAAFLTELAGSRDLLTRQALLVTREPRRPGPGTARGAGGGLRAAQRTAEAARLLGAADLTVSALDGAQVTALLTAAADPGADIHATRLAVPGEPVTSPGTLP